jgi:hypothetical protein
MKPVRFTAQVLSGHKEDAVEVAFDPGQAWGIAAVPFRPKRRGYPVAATINSLPFRSFVVSRSRRLFLLIPPRVLERAGVAVGASLQVSLSQPSTSDTPVVGAAPRRAATPKRRPG